MRSQSKNKGFTLIELLIVVAIIAILAAIAVPNFLEAQVRAKVSRASADLKTVSLGLEMYRVDNNSLPYTEHIESAVWMVPGGFPQPVAGGDTANTQFFCGGVTSPIAYITSVPIDAFEHSFTGQNGEILFGKGPLYYDKPGFAFKDGNFQPNFPTRVPSDTIGTSSLDGDGPDTLTNDPNASPSDYALYSLGPDLDLVVRDATGQVVTASKFNINNRYDSTNGTISVGNVVRYAGSEVFP